MNLKKFTYLFAILLLVIIGVYSCSRYYINHGFRENYTNTNDAIHNASLSSSYFKIHLKNGDVCLLDNWELTSNKDSIKGQGNLFDFNRNQFQEGDLSLNIDDIAIIETNQLDAIKSKDKERISSLSILTGANLAIDIFCITNPKACFGSCPTFYIQEGSLFHYANAEGFSSSISPSLEKQDLDALQYSTSSNEFSLFMKNEAFETHMVNELFVQAVPKKFGENIFHDKNKVFYNCGPIFNSNSALVDNKPIGNSINNFDDNEYYSPSDEFDLAAKEEIVLEFDNIPSRNLGAVINFRQTLLTTYLLYTGISYMGNEVGDYFTKIETNKKVKKLLSNPFKRLGNIKIFVWNELLKDWELFEELYETGPIAKNLMIAPLPNLTRTDDKIKIKVELTKGLWRIDYFGLTPINSVVKPLKLYPTDLEIIDGEDYSLDQVKYYDNKYLISFPGNEFKFNFKFPDLKKDNEYELFLSSKGYYLEWIREDWIVNKDLPKLKKMLLNDDKTWLDLAKHFKSVESEMEEVFWNSKYYDTQ